MSGEFLCLGLSHHQTPVALRESVGFRRERLGDALNMLKTQPLINEGLILSTCNRVEVYAHGKSEQAIETLENFLSVFHEIPRNSLKPHLYRLKGVEAAEHFFRVASSLDSLVVGEAQILGQVKEAIAVARETQTIGPNLNLMLNFALAAAKRIRTETQIARHTVSISHIAVELIESVFSTVQKRKTLLVGAGKMAEVAGRCLFEKGAELKIVNRTKTNACALSDKFGAQAFTFDSLFDLLVECDIVLTSTNAVGHLINKDLVRELMRKRRYRPIFFVDIAVPRNIDPSVSDIDGSYLYNIDDLAKIANNRLLLREEHNLHAHAILKEEIVRFKVKHDERLAAPFIKELRKEGFDVADREVNKLLEGLSVKLSDEDALLVKKAAYSIVNKLLHRPTMEIKSQAGSPEIPTSNPENLLLARHLYKAL